jgi:hypothetical protein
MAKSTGPEKTFVRGGPFSPEFTLSAGRKKFTSNFTFGGVPAAPHWKNTADHFEVQYKDLHAAQVRDMWRSVLRNNFEGSPDLTYRIWWHEGGPDGQVVEIWPAE